MRRLAAALAVLVVAGCGGSPGPAEHLSPLLTTPTATETAASPPSPVVTARKPRPRPRPKANPGPVPNPGSLPQTDQLPSAGSRAFHAEMDALWTGVQTDSLNRAMPAFFPLGAYVQVKALGDPQGDYSNRLVVDYGLDLAAAHALLGSDPASAGLVGVELPPSSVHWVPPGACYNRVGYYEWPNARLVYRQNGAIHSFGIASMISWRGVWYVVHLGAIVRPSASGIVDDPSSGVGISIPSSTC